MKSAEKVGALRLERQTVWQRTSSGLNFRRDALGVGTFIMAAISNHIILACWILFFVYWLVSAQRVKAVAEKQSLASALAHRLPVGLGWWLLAYPRLPRTDLTRLVGVLVGAYGLCITICARRTLAGNWSSDVTFKQGHELIRSGPYRFVRHPIYTGLLIMSLGSAIEIGRRHGAGLRLQPDLFRGDAAHAGDG